MLDKDSLSQLKQLKRQIEDSKEYAEGVVKATQRKFGFLVTEEHREIYLSPDEMQKVFPGDRVRIQVFTDPPPDAGNNGKNGKGGGKAKIHGAILKLLESPLKEFAGRYVVRGKGHFVEPDLPHINRWIFVPPAMRNGAKEGDYVYCRINRHPWPQGKPQANVLEVIGPDDRPGIEADYMIAKFQLEPRWPKEWQAELQDPDIASREDLTAVPFVTIDAASTQDMDDALYACKTDSGWRLQVAIADPSALIREGSKLDNIIRRRATSVYMPGRAVPMLPEGLANDQCSLLPDTQRPALVCTLELGEDGGVNSTTFSEAVIRSRAKLSYQQVAAFLAGTGEGEPDEQCQSQADNLTALGEATAALANYRRQHYLVIPARPEFRMFLNEQKKLDRIEPVEKSRAHQLVEECMIATNYAAAEFLGDRGVFIEHPGFRQERLPDVRKLAEEQLGITDVDFDTPSGYRQLMNAIDDDALQFPLRAVLSRLLERSRLSATPAPHQGLGLPRYTTVTSPIRKYSDLTAQRSIKARLHEQRSPNCNEQLLATLQERQDNARQAGYQLEQWLKCEFMQALVGQTFSGRVTQVNSNGFSVRIEPHLIEGFVETRQLNEKYSFDPMRLRLKSKQMSIELGQEVSVTVREVDSKLRRIHLALAEQAATSEESTAATAAVNATPDSGTEAAAEQQQA